MFESQINYRFLKESIMIFNSSFLIILISIDSLSLFSKILKIYAINSTSFLRLTRKKNHDLFVIFMQNIDKV